MIVVGNWLGSFALWSRRDSPCLRFPVRVRLVFARVVSNGLVLVSECLALDICSRFAGSGQFGIGLVAGIQDMLPVLLTGGRHRRANAPRGRFVFQILVAYLWGFFAALIGHWRRTSGCGFRGALGEFGEHELPLAHMLGDGLLHS